MHRNRSALSGLAFGLWALVCPFQSAGAHGDLDARIAALDVQIAANPLQGRSWLRRAELHEEHGAWSAALSDLSRAAARSAAPETVAVARARVLLAAHRCVEALAELASVPSASEHRYTEIETLRARCLAHLGRPEKAAAAYARALSAAPGSPEHYAAWAAELERAGQIDEAVAALDQGIAALGGAIALERAALALEVRAGRLPAALARLDQLTAGARRPQPWWFERGRILEDAGRPVEAREAYHRALGGPAPHTLRRGTPAARRLESGARAALARLDAEKL